jgi:hypothetical protein
MFLNVAVTSHSISGIIFYILVVRRLILIRRKQADSEQPTKRVLPSAYIPAISDEEAERFVSMRSIFCNVTVLKAIVKDLPCTISRPNNSWMLS